MISELLPPRKKIVAFIAIFMQRNVSSLCFPILYGDTHHCIRNGTHPRALNPSMDTLRLTKTRKML